MHSILESDGVSSDPYEVLCHMGTLIIEGRTPKHVGETTASGETVAKSTKPYNEGPHCPNFMKLYNKETHNGHKCAENNILCIRHNNLKQTLQSLFLKSSKICIEVSLGPDCLCGELRSQSTLVASQPSKRDIILEQWTITIGHKQIQEPTSQMSIMNLYQAVRSLLHFSQLTAWYMSNQGMKPAHVIYRVAIPEDCTFISDDNFVSHVFPVADVNKTNWMKICVKTLPRMEKIPSVFCPQHHSVTVDIAQGPLFDGKEPQKLNKDKSYLSPEPLHPEFSADDKAELLESKLPLKFQGVRKKTIEMHERKRKKNIRPSTLVVDYCYRGNILDGMPRHLEKISQKEDPDYFSCKRMFQRQPHMPYQGESSKVDYRKSKPSPLTTDLSELVKPQPDFESFDTFSCTYFEHKVLDPTLDLMIGLKNISDSKSKSDFRTKGKTKSVSEAEKSSSESSSEKFEGKTAMEILDDRMQISCAISGKHHCKWECEEENDFNNPGGNVEKPKRRRSLSKVGLNENIDDVKIGRSETEKVFHGKFKDIDRCKSELCSPHREFEGNENSEVDSCAQKTFSFADNFQSSRTPHSESPSKLTAVINLSSLVENSGKLLTPKIECLPQGEFRGVEKISEAKDQRSSQRERSPDIKGSSSWIRTESFESFRKGCTFVRDGASEFSSDSESENADGLLETSNPFLAAILRTTKKSKSPRNSKTCDNIVKNKINNVSESSRGRFLIKLKDPIKNYVNVKMNDLKAKVDACEKFQLNGESSCCGSHKLDKTNLDLSSDRKKSPVEKRYDLVGEEASGSGSSEFLSKSLSRLKSLFDNQDLKSEDKTSDGCDEFSDDNSSNNSNSTKTIPVPSAHDKLKFRRSLDSAAQLVFHRCSGLPLTSSPAPVRRNNSSFSFDSSLNSVSAIKSALFEPSNSLSSEDENESEGSLKSPASPGAWSIGSKQINYHSLSPLPLLGSFEESVLNGRLEPVSTVQGFTAELGASGSFCPRHLYLPVTVFFYTLGDNDKVSAPYLGHINLGKKGYTVPRSGTIQVTLFNPMRTVVKMFVVVYDLHDMPPNSHTFLRQRTLYVPASQRESTYTDNKEPPFDQEDYHKYLRYLIHLRFVSGKSGKIYLHTDIRMVIFRKADEDTATALGNQSDGEAYELRSHTHGPINPKFSPRK